MKKRKDKIIILGIFLVIFGLYLSIPDGKLRLVFCDVGQGDGALIIKGNWQMMIDSGADNGKMERCLDRYLPFWDKKIEAAVISHWDKDHGGALPKIMNSYQIERLFESGLSEEAIEQKSYTEILRAGDIVRYGEIYFEVIYPGENLGNGNESSLVIVLNYGDKKFMFTGDVDRAGEGEMMTWWQEGVEGIKISHHGSDSGGSEDWLKRIKPAVAVISVGENSYGHPKEIVLERLKQSGVKILRTDLLGDITLGWD
ncbi:MAG TPA: MBL fold metallo-hydrolase [Candidatus Woesebacteria bacterium]|nr:MBL fold metallo-hydrolase [Candidatus Woesebacteria bacterium]HPR99512.1 MBL fold metallo-hydrolase [Candidatus Woesebacteria bacterium]